MPGQSEGTAVERAVAAMPAGRWLLAVSGGRDSMALFAAMAAARRDEIAAVATFDHGTGVAARRACALVERVALERGVPAVSGAMVAQPRARQAERAGPRSASTEADWRTERWRFLRAWAAELKATVVTAHTRDDQVETVAMRILRGAGARGLAGMGAVGVVMRPLLGVARADVAAYALAHRLPFVEDPSNVSRHHLRNRMRLDLLPALEAAAPGFAAWCLDVAARAAVVRAGLDGAVEALAPTVTPDGTLVVSAAAVASLGAGEWAALWPALAARVGVAMDRRGIERAAAWAPRARPGSAIPLAGGAGIARTAGTFVVSRGPGGTPPGGADYILNE